VASVAPGRDGFPRGRAASAHNVGRDVAGLNGGSIRLIVRPTISGQSLRVKLTNIRTEAPAAFSAGVLDH
jgi:hypothetical protein